MKKVVMYTDGASRGNPGPGGYGTVLKYGDHRKELSGGYRKTTNNRMELIAVIKGLEALKGEGWQVEVYSDSQYLVNAIKEGWVFGWEKKDYKKKKNVDLWKRLMKLYRQHKVNLHWIRGHSNITENERCDDLAVQAAENHPTRIDKGYEERKN
jgi:ribonuclease HI